MADRVGGLSCDRGNHGRTDYDLVCRRRTGRSDCVRRRCRYTGAVDPVFSHFTGPLIFTRPLAVRYMNKGVPKTNVNSLIGEKAVVIQKINNLEQTGQVRINDIEWMARTSSDEVTIPEQTVVTIEAVQGVKLIVKEEKEGK